MINNSAKRRRVANARIIWRLRALVAFQAVVHVWLLAGGWPAWAMLLGVGAPADADARLHEGAPGAVIDLLYLAAFAVVASALTPWAWLVFLAVPAYALWSAAGALRGCCPARAVPLQQHIKKRLSLRMNTSVCRLLRWISFFVFAVVRRRGVLAPDKRPPVVDVRSLGRAPPKNDGLARAPTGVGRPLEHAARVVHYSVGHHVKVRGAQDLLRMHLRGCDARDHDAADGARHLRVIDVQDVADGTPAARHVLVGPRRHVQIRHGVVVRVRNWHLNFLGRLRGAIVLADANGPGVHSRHGNNRRGIIALGALASLVMMYYLLRKIVLHNLTHVVPPRSVMLVENDGVLRTLPSGRYVLNWNESPQLLLEIIRQYVWAYYDLARFIPAG